MNRAPTFYDKVKEVVKTLDGKVSVSTPRYAIIRFKTEHDRNYAFPLLQKKLRGSEIKKFETTSVIIDWSS